MTSLGASLTRQVCLVVFPLVLLVGVCLFAFVNAALVARFDDGLFSSARMLMGMVKVEDAGLDVDFATESLPQYVRADGGQFFELWSLQGDVPGGVIERSGSLGAYDLPYRVSAVDSPVWDAVLPSGERGRLAAVVFTPYIDKESVRVRETGVTELVRRPLLLVVACSRAEMDRTLSLFAGALCAGGLILIGCVLWAVRGALRRGLRPVADLAATVGSLGPDDLSGRLATTHAPSELLPIVEGTNGLLDRLRDAFDREKRLAALAAHELRTPIAEVRSVAELALSQNRDVGFLRHALEQVVEVVERMGQSADAVLRMARVQAGRERPNVQRIELLDLLRPVWERWVAPLIGREVQGRLSVSTGTTVLADAGMLRVVLDNVLANAAEHTSRGGTIEARMVVNGAGVSELCISNTVGGIREIEAGKQVHSGLGLLIARAMSEACGLSFDAQVVGSGFLVRIGFA